MATVLVAGSEKAAAHRLGLSHSTVKHHLANARSKVGAETTAQLVWILAPRLPEPEGTAQTDGERRPRSRLEVPQPAVSTVVQSTMSNGVIPARTPPGLAVGSSGSKALPPLPPASAASRRATRLS